LPIHIQVRSHQSWLNTTLEQMGAQPSGQYTLLVKHLASSQKMGVLNEARNRREARQAKPTVPIIRNLSSNGVPKESKNGLK
jgi:hypothetical protein